MSHLDARIDDYVDDALSASERREIDAHLAVCAACRSEVEATRSLVSRIQALPREMTPKRDLWPEVSARVAPRKSRVLPWVGGAFAAGLLAASCAGAFVLARVLWSSDAEALERADAILADGNLPEAAARYDALVAEGEAEPAVDRAAYMAFLAGDYARAEALLARLPPSPDVEMRRAIVALRSGDLDGVRRHGKASGLAAGFVLAAEVHLADSELEEAAKLLHVAAADTGVVGATARTYLDYLNEDLPAKRGLAEATALWALGQRAVACEAAVNLVPALAVDDENRDTELLLWAGRAVTSGKPEVAEMLLDQIAFPPEGQAWRVIATRGLVAAAKGDIESSATIFDMLERGGAPADGLADARATAAALVRDPDAARRLVRSEPSIAGARALEAAGAPVLADTLPDGGFYGRYLRSR